MEQYKRLIATTINGYRHELCAHDWQLSASESALVPIFFSPAHQADLMVGHGEHDILLIDSSRVAIELGCDINATRDGSSSMYLGLELVHLGDLHRNRLQVTHMRSRCVRDGVSALQAQLSPAYQ